MKKLHFWQIMAMWTLIEQEKEGRASSKYQGSKTFSILHKEKHSRSLGQHRYMYLSKRSR